MAALSSLLALTMGGTAHAVDTNTTTATAVAAAGSDTIDELVGGLSGLTGLTGDIANYNSLGSATVNTTANFPGSARAAGANCTFTRPNGSGAGKSALSAAMRGAAYGGSSNIKECLGLARSSSSGFPSGADLVPTGSMARIPLGLDAVAPATLKGGLLFKRQSFTWLKDVYTRNGVAGSNACLGVIPLIPQFNSGTRSFWASQLGITDWDFSGSGGSVGTVPGSDKQTWGSCVTGGAANPKGVGTAAGNGNPGDRIGGATGAPIQEHSGTVLSNVRQIVPYSVAQYIVQGSGIANDSRGSAVLMSVDFTSTTNDVNDADVKHPYALNGGSGAAGFTGTTGVLTREVYAFVPHALYDKAYTAPSGADGFSTISDTDKDRFKAAFANGTSSRVCSTSTVQLFGFSPVSGCGTPTLN